MDDVVILADSKISIHALREEGDDEGGVYTITLEAFLSTPSARRATPRDRGH